MPRKLDLRHAEDIAGSLSEMLDDLGYTPEETIPGLVQTILVLAGADDQMLDEAANLLADGGV